VFLVHGEYEVQKAYKQRMLESGFRDIEIPAWGEEFSL